MPWDYAAPDLVLIYHNKEYWKLSSLFQEVLQMDKQEAQMFYFLCLESEKISPV